MPPGGSEDRSIQSERGGAPTGMGSHAGSGPSSSQMFSNCSKQSIYKTIESKAQECFQERSNKVCGNSRVDEGEECDPGMMYLNNDTCCHHNCTLKAGVQCRWAARGRAGGGGRAWGAGIQVPAG